MRRTREYKMYSKFLDIYTCYTAIKCNDYFREVSHGFTIKLGSLTIDVSF